MFGLGFTRTTVALFHWSAWQNESEHQDPEAEAANVVLFSVTWPADPSRLTQKPFLQSFSEVQRPLGDKQVLPSVLQFWVVGPVTFGSVIFSHNLQVQVPFLQRSSRIDGKHTWNQFSLSGPVWSVTNTLVSSGSPDLNPGWNTGPKLVPSNCFC